MFEMELADELFDLLMQPGLRSAVFELFDLDFAEAERRRDLPIEECLKKERGLLDQEVEKLFQDCVVSRLSEPYPITSSELTDLAKSHIAGLGRLIHSGDALADDVWELFCIKVREQFPNPNYVQTRELKSISVGRWSGVRRLFSVAKYRNKPIWRSNWFELRVHPGQIPLQHWENELSEKGEYSEIELKAALKGDCSDVAYAMLFNQLEEVLRSIANTVTLSRTHEELGLKQPYHHSITDFYCIDSLLRSFMGVNPDYPAAPIEYLFGEEQGRLFRDCIDAVVLPQQSENRDTLLGCLSVAIGLLAAADAQSKQNLSLVLSVSALETLLCGKKRWEGPDEKNRSDGKSLQLQDRLPALLMATADAPTKDERKACVRNVYNLRSRVVHGEKNSEVPVEAMDARRLAAGAIRACFKWRHECGSMGGI